MIPTHKVINKDGKTCYRGSLTACTRYIVKTKNTKHYGIKKL